MRLAERQSIVSGVVMKRRRVELSSELKTDVKKENQMFYTRAEIAKIWCLILIVCYAHRSNVRLPFPLRRSTFYTHSTCLPTHPSTLTQQCLVEEEAGVVGEVG